MTRFIAIATIFMAIALPGCATVPAQADNDLSDNERTMAQAIIENHKELQNLKQKVKGLGDAVVTDIDTLTDNDMALEERVNAIVDALVEEFKNLEYRLQRLEKQYENSSI